MNVSSRKIFPIFFVIMIFLKSAAVGVSNIPREIVRIKFLQVVDYSLKFINDGILLKGDPKIDLNRLTGCDMLWVSRANLYIQAPVELDLMRKIQNCPRDEFVKRWLGQLAWDQHQYQSALDYWSGLTIVQLIGLGSTYFDKGDIERGVAILELADRKFYQSPDVRIDYLVLYLMYNRLALYYQNHDNWERAKYCYLQLWTRNKNDKPIRIALARSFRMTHQCGQSINLLEEMLLEMKRIENITMYDFYYYYELGQCYLETGQTEKAIESLNIAMSILEIDIGFSETVIQNYQTLIQTDIQKVKP